MDLQRTGRIFGWLFIGTFVTSIPARLLFIDGVGRELDRHALRRRGRLHASLKWGAVLEFGLIVTQIGTAVVIYPLLRRQSETVSLGYVTARVMESVFAAIGIISIISVVSVVDALDGASGAAATALDTQGNSLVHTYEWAFEWGPGLVAGIGNGMMLGYLMYRSGLVPPRMALLGLIGGPLLILSFVMMLTGVYKNGEGPSGLLTLPEAAWELSLGIYCAWKGFRHVEPARQARDRDGGGRAITAARTGWLQLRSSGTIIRFAASSDGTCASPFEASPGDPSRAAQRWTVADRERAHG